MSFADKITMLMTRGGDNAQQKDDDSPMWMRYAGRALGTVGSAIAILFGLLNCLGIFTINVPGVLAGIWQMLAGFIVMVCEAPCCCFFIDYVQALSDKLESRPIWNKAALYVGLALPPLFFNFFSFATIIGSGLILGTGIIYGMMALGKKASADDMRTSAANMESGLATHTTTAPRANLVTSEQPMSFTGAPSY